MSRCRAPFFQGDPVTCARELIGCRLVWGACEGIIVETEAYAAEGDEASHTWTRPSAREFVAKHRPGAAYVYFNYGVHWMLNVLTKGGSVDGFVLFRALEPTRGLAAMAKRREGNRRKATGPLPPTALCSGPGKLAQALGVTGADHGGDFCAGKRHAIYPAVAPPRVVEGVRIGISRSQHLHWRFVLHGSAHLSVPIHTAPR